MSANVDLSTSRMSTAASDTAWSLHLNGLEIQQLRSICRLSNLGTAPDGSKSDIIKWILKHSSLESCVWTANCITHISFIRLYRKCFEERIPTKRREKRSLERLIADHLKLGNADPAEDTSTEASFLEANGLLSGGSKDCLTKRIKLFDNGNHSTDFETMSQLDLKLYASLYGLDSSTADQHLPMLLREHMDKRRSSLNGAALTQLAEHASAATTMPPATNKTPGQCTEPYSVIVDGATVHFPPLLDGTLVEFSASDIGDEGQ